ncbi:L-fucose isomerase [Paenibacillaceae bacterium WGS1546]|uniref:L-fucose isomerase n=1 Tax=Cohnella sp. WGS1546 TaxID=3366810 RepID=UPI00372D1F9F
MNTAFSKPAIGIRPVIDGRTGGVREQLEEQTMRMAESVAALIRDQLRYSDGTPVQCIVADTCIGGIQEARQADEKFSKAHVGATISVTPCWAYGSETIDTDPFRPKAIWGFNGSERSGAVYLAAALAAHNQKGLPAFGIYGQDVQDKEDGSIPEDVRNKLLQFARSAIAVAEMRNQSYLSIGSVSMGIAGSIVNEDFFQSYLGMHNEYVDMSEISRRIELGIYDEEEYRKALAWTQNYCKEGADFNTPGTQLTREKKDDVWRFVVKMTLIIRDLMIGNPRLAELGYTEEALGHHAVAAGFQGQRHWNDYLPNGDFSEAMLNSSFDWNGIRQPFVVATENDSLNAVTMLFGKLLTNTAQSFVDIRTYWSPDSVERVTGYKLEGLAAGGIIHLKNSGSVALDSCGEQSIDGKPGLKPYWDISEEEMNRCLEATTWHPAHQGYFRGGGFSSRVLSRGGMPITLSRLNLVKGLGPVLQIAQGYTVDLPEQVHNMLDNRTDPAWPTAWFAPIITGKGAFKDVYTVMNSWGANHGSFSYGHIGGDLITLASMLRIPVTMHNVPEEQIFRPSSWLAFGIEEDYVGTDYRACANYGPLYSAL